MKRTAFRLGAAVLALAAAAVDAQTAAPRHRRLFPRTLYLTEIPLVTTYSNGNPWTGWNGRWVDWPLTVDRSIRYVEGVQYRVTWPDLRRTFEEMAAGGMDGTTFNVASRNLDTLIVEALARGECLPVLTVPDYPPQKRLFHASFDGTADAESADGIRWEKYGQNPIFSCAPENLWEQNRIGACEVLPEDGGYLMFYIGYRDIHTACICAARSKDGVTGWRRVPENPLVTPGEGCWDSESCYKPTVVRAPDGTYRLWYNGRTGGCEYIGYATGTIS